MRKNILISIAGIILLLTVSGVYADPGSGEVKIGFTFIDEEGNQAVNQSTFNQYEGFNLSLEKFKYSLSNGIRFKADLKRITLNNRNLSFGLEKSGLFGLRLNNNQYRRVYSFDGHSFIRRHTTSGNLWFYPHRYIKLFGGGSFVGRSGSVTDLFILGNSLTSTTVNYEQKHAYGGVRINHRGRMFRAEYGSIDYTNKENYYLDQSRRWIKLFAFAPVPGYERIRLNAGYLNYRTWYQDKDIEIHANKVFGGTKVKLPLDFAVSYSFIFERSSSDSDKVATENLAHTFYASHIWPSLAGVTVGYQHDISDDFEDIVRANSYYFSGWLKPNSSIEFRSEYGFRAEKVDEGSRHIGDEDRNRFRISCKYKNAEYGSLKLKYEIKNRNNDQLGSEADFNRLALDMTARLADYADLSIGYSYSVGEYTNTEQEFEFRDHLLYGDVMLQEYYNIEIGAGIVYYSSKRDLDIESITLRTNGRYRFLKNYHLELIYNVYNFDDFLVNDRYVTSNIVEANIVKDISF